MITSRASKKYYHYCIITILLLFLPGEGLIHVRLFWKKVYRCPMRCFSFVLRGSVRLKNKATRMFHRFSSPSTEPLDAQPFLIQEYI